LTPFLHANRLPLRSNTLSAPALLFSNHSSERRSDVGGQSIRRKLLVKKLRLAFEHEGSTTPDNGGR
jgi:hypothetical protein